MAHRRMYPFWFLRKSSRATYVPRATAETAGEFGIGRRRPKGSAWVNLRTLSAKARTPPGRRVRLDR